jgi:hypothetical protein
LENARNIQEISTFYRKALDKHLILIYKSSASHERSSFFGGKFLMLATSRRQIGISPIATRQHHWMRRPAVSGMPELCVASDFANDCRVDLLGNEPKQEFLANPKPSDCFDNKV